MIDSDRLVGAAQNTGRIWSAWYAPHRAIIALGTLLFAVAVAVAGGTLGVVNSAQAEKSTALISDRYLILQQPVREIRAAVANFQVLAEHVFVGSIPGPAVLAAGEADTNVAAQAYLKLQRLLSLSGNATLAPHLSTQMAAYVAARSNLGAFIAGEKAPAQLAQLAVIEQKADMNLDAALGAWVRTRQ